MASARVNPYDRVNELIPTDRTIVLILLSTPAFLTGSKVTTILREAFAATPLGIVIEAVRASRRPRTRSMAVASVRSAR